jgi:hypothetical protein
MTRDESKRSIAIAAQLAVQRTDSTMKWDAVATNSAAMGVKNAEFRSM